MAIRLRKTELGLVAICAARSVPAPGDIYLDDEAHMALAYKFWSDYPEVSLNPPVVDVVLRLREESNNTNATEWEQIYGLGAK